RFIEKLSSEVAGSNRKFSILKKNDFGKGGYQDHYWFAFYDPEAGSKIKSVQLFFGLHGTDKVCRYGFAMGDYCKAHFQRLNNVVHKSSDEIAEYVGSAPEGAIFELLFDEKRQRLSANEFSDRIKSTEKDPVKRDEGLTGIQIVREFSLDDLPERDDTLIDEVGSLFTWTWPFFEASMTGVWPEGGISNDTAGHGSEDEGVDEDAPASLEELGDSTSLAESFLGDLEQALLAKQQTILVGPPGTSKTYIARQFARYFVRDTAGRPQGTHHTLYMHSNWSYEDFFEGIRPTTSEDGTLGFKPQKGFFLEWVEQLKNFDPRARHVLVLDEINRCDTASVLGELLQLLEYRGTTIRLLSGRHFVFPKNLYIIGTMNSADRSIGRMDLALRRRFLWMNLHCQPETLRRWLKRAGNNPVGFDHSQLAQCNELLSNRGISPEQHIGHALFMAQESGVDDESETPGDIPLTENHLRRIVKFSVIPYVEELLVTQFGQVDGDLIRVINDKLLSCLSESDHQN
ncbi:MAG: AAA domain-containing protein, partial [Planctomycetaceae bacterium]|nr:AAA domain-containing protein [Planctomycetaceae bacterium]